MLTLTFVLTFCCLALAIFALGSAALTPASNVRQRMQWLLGRELGIRTNTPIKSRFEQVLEPLSKAVPKSPDDVSETRGWLMQAGYRNEKHVFYYYGIRMLAVLFVLFFTAVSGLLTRAPLAALCLGALGYILPRFLLKRRIAHRQLALQLALPDALDLAVICVEAGLGMDEALRRVGNELKNAHREMAEELELVNLELRAGKPRPDALRNLALRTGVDDIRAFVAVLIQTDRFGTSIANALRVHSDALRTERKQRAEERAAKTTIKMVPVLVLFVFPAMFIVILGPAILAAVRQILPAVEK